MAERLTNTLEETPTLGFGLKFCSDRNCNSDEDCCNCYAFNQTINKLRQFEDIMEKYGIESVEELDEKLANFDNFMKGNKFETIEDLQNALNGKFIEVFDEKNKIWQAMVKNLTKTEQDRDTWKRACELACEREDDCYVYDNIHRAYEFYQQAKKEGENK